MASFWRLLTIVDLLSVLTGSLVLGQGETLAERAKSLPGGKVFISTCVFMAFIRRL